VHFIEIRDILWFNFVSKVDIREKYLIELTRENFHWYLDGVATKLFKIRDMFYMSDDMTLLSSFERNGFTKFSERLKRNFKGY
jgi:hypothetical protein